MSKASWVLVSPQTGNGNKTINVSGEVHTGRNARTTTLTITAADVEDHYVTVNQAGKPEYVDEQDTATAAKAGQTVTISGKSNSKKLTFSLGTGNLNIDLPENYTANSVSTPNGTEIVGDPGASAEYDFSIQFVVAVNETITELTRQIKVSDEAGHTDVCTLTQAAGDATLTVSKENIDLAYTGEAVSFDITSNTSWSIV